jgi:predicted phage terminase large subunit-like protein
VGVEDGALGLVFKDLLAGLPLRGLKAGSDKVSRLVAVSRFFEAGRVYFLNSVNKIQELHDQLMEFPNGAHDDMVDALVYAVRMLLVDGATQTKVSDFVVDGWFEEDMV